MNFVYMYMYGTAWTENVSSRRHARKPTRTHQHVPLPDKKMKKNLEKGYSPFPTPLHRPNPLGAFGVPVPFYLPLEH